MSGRIFKSPFSNRTHYLPAYEDEYILNNSTTRERKFKEDFKNSALTEPNWNLNKWSTREDTFNDITLDKDQITSLTNRVKRNTKPNKNYNW